MLFGKSQFVHQYFVLERLLVRREDEDAVQAGQVSPVSTNSPLVGRREGGLVRSRALE